MENLERLLWSKDRKSQKFKPQVTSGFRIKLGPQVRGGGGGGRGEGGANTFTSMLSLQPNGLMCPLNEC